jgi:hypothetical protein
MFVYWIYALLSIFYSWLFYKLTDRNVYGIIFYIISLIIIGIYYLIVIIIDLFIDLKYKKATNSLECKSESCKQMIKQYSKCNEECNNDIVSEECNNYCNSNYQDLLCKNIIHCDNHYLCRRKNSRCVIKDEGCKRLIDQQIQIIKNKKENELKSAIKTLDDIGIRKKTLEEYLEVNIYVLSFLFLLIFLYLFYKKQITIILDLTFLDLNYIRNIIKKYN